MAQHVIALARFLNLPEDSTPLAVLTAAKAATIMKHPDRCPQEIDYFLQLLPMWKAAKEEVGNEADWQEFLKTMRLPAGSTVAQVKRFCQSKYEYTPDYMNYRELALEFASELESGNLDPILEYMSDRDGATDCFRYYFGIYLYIKWAEEKIPKMAARLIAAGYEPDPKEEIPIFGAPLGLHCFFQLQRAVGDEIDEVGDESDEGSASPAVRLKMEELKKMPLEILAERKELFVFFFLEAHVSKMEEQDQGGDEEDDGESYLARRNDRQSELIQKLQEENRALKRKHELICNSDHYKITAE